MKMLRIEAMDSWMLLEIGWANSNLGTWGLRDAFIEALENQGVLKEAGINYIKCRDEENGQMDITFWAPLPEEEPQEVEVTGWEDDEGERLPNV